eukprot:CAMPEP_0176267554 /NCGR_PEP_ID=MMETSP0121_2-20121125/43218_1 /TAXON_ID=160619 /ORGANISM="Kryptoperidinium foliaceum, Strain CCMP 1326" /LENGTH=133 /DNA_ID=CAMNT_0017607619 /DNA_START=19 /DNA_END=417 /DNA_ORIENTATION=+
MAPVLPRPCRAAPRPPSLGEREQALLVQQPVQASVALAAGADEAGEREGVELPGVDAVLVHLAHVQLHGAVLLRGDEAVRGRALPGKVQVDDAALVVLHGFGADWSALARNVVRGEECMLSGACGQNGLSQNG